MPLSHDQLQEWYAKLKITLYERVNIDMTRREDLGRVRIARINEWNHANPDAMPPVDMIYPFIPHRVLGREEASPDPLLSYYCYEPPAPSRENAEEYHQWLLDNISTAAPSDTLIQELYDMAKEGQLLVFDAAAGLPHQVQLKDGEIHVTDSFDDILRRREFPMAPLIVEAPTIELPSLPARPNEPPQPGQAPTGIMGFFSRIGAFFGIKTEHAKYLDRKKAYDAYLTAVTTWEQTCAERRIAWEAEEPQRAERYEQQRAEYSNYFSQVSTFFLDPLARFSIAWGGIGRRVQDADNDAITAQRESEEIFWAGQHRKTVQGELQSGIDAVTAFKEEVKDLRTNIGHMLGPVYRNNGDRIAAGVVKRHTLSPYAVPASNKMPITDKEASLICFAALADTTVLGTPVADDSLETLGSSERYNKIVDGFFLKCEDGSDYLFPFVPEARELGVKAMRAFVVENKPKQLALLLGHCLRRQNELAPYTGELYSAKAHSITAGILDVLDARPALLEHLPISPEELWKARANAAIYRLNEQGLQAKADLLSHSLYQKQLSDEALQNAAADLLLLNSLNAQAAKGQDISAIVMNPASLQQLRNTLLHQDGVKQLAKLDPTELGKAVAFPETLFSKIKQLNPEGHKAPMEKIMDVPQVIKSNPVPYT